MKTERHPRILFRQALNSRRKQLIFDNLQREAYEEGKTDGFSQGKEQGYADGIKKEKNERLSMEIRKNILYALGQMGESMAKVVLSSDNNL